MKRRMGRLSQLNSVTLTDARRMVSTEARRSLAARLSSACLAAGALLFVAPSALAALQITPQMVVDSALSKGRQAKTEDLRAQGAYLAVAQALGVYDLQLAILPSYQFNRAQTLQSSADTADRDIVLQTYVEKMFSTGTSLRLEYDVYRENATLNQYAPEFRNSLAAMDVGKVTLRQSLWRNAFGYADRLALAAARENLETAQKVRDENIQTVALNAMQLFWNAYTNEQQFKENVEARDKYRQLVGDVRRKTRFSLSSAGELPRLQAELDQTDARVKSSSALYLSSIDQLLTAMQVQTSDAVELVVPAQIPPVPQLPVKQIDDLRAVQAERLAYQVSQNTLEAVKSQNTAQVDLVAVAASTGVDEDPRYSYAQMTSGTRPTYYVGMEVRTALDSALYRGQIANAKVNVLQAENSLGIQRDNVRDLLAQLARTVSADFDLANLTRTASQERSQVVRQMEAAYRQGRQPLVELIRAYDDLFQAQLNEAKAIGDYHIALNQLAAARDELVPDRPEAKR